MRRIDIKKKTSTSTIVVRASPLDRRRAIVRCGPLCFQATLGRSGITSIKREGDGATPRASMTVLSGYRRGDRNGQIRTGLPLTRIRADMLWCDAPTHASYNHPVRAPFAASHEKLLRQDKLYDICLVLDWNLRARRLGCGSAIFFHVARPGYPPTEGCVALSMRDVLTLAPHVRTGTRLKVL